MVRTTFVTAVLAAAALALPRAQAAPPRIVFDHGRVTIAAADTLVSDLLAEWERAGGTKVAGADKLPATRVTVVLVNADEIEALREIVGPSGGYLFTRRSAPTPGQSTLASLIVGAGMAPGAAPPRPSASDVDMSIPESRFEYAKPFGDDQELVERMVREMSNPDLPAPTEPYVMPEMRFLYPGAVIEDAPPEEPTAGAASTPKVKKPPSER